VVPSAELGRPGCCVIRVKYTCGQLARNKPALVPSSFCLAAHAVLSRKHALHKCHDGMVLCGVVDVTPASWCEVTTSVSRSRVSCSLMIFRSVNGRRRDPQVSSAAVASFSDFFLQPVCAAVV